MFARGVHDTEQSAGTHNANKQIQMNEMVRVHLPPLQKGEYSIPKTQHEPPSSTLPLPASVTAC